METYESESIVSCDKKNATRHASNSFKLCTLKSTGNRPGQSGNPGHPDHGIL